MSSMLKKKGALSFKPKAPQIRRPPGQSVSTTSSSRPSAEPQSQSQGLATPGSTVQIAPQSSQPQNQYAGRSNATRPILPAQLSSQTQRRTGSSTRSISVGDVSEPPIIDHFTTSREIPPVSHIEPSPSPDVSRDRQELSVTQAQQAAQKATQSTRNSTTRAQITQPDISVEKINRTTVTHPLQPATATLKDVPSTTTRQSQPGPTSASIPTDLETIETTAKPKRVTKRKKVEKSTEPGDEVRPSIEEPEILSAPPLSRASSEPKLAVKRRKRETTPVDAEEQVVDHSTMKMAELCKDLRIGKKFSKHDEIRQRDKERKAASRLSRINRSTTRDSNTPAVVSEREETTVEGDGPQLRIVDGEIVVDDRSLVVNRHQRAAANADDMEVIEENDFSRITTSGTFMKRENSYYWNTEDTEKFYKGLRMFGADFGMIAMMFPQRTRKQVKLKFNKEERAFPKKVERALLHERIPVDMDEILELSGAQLEEVENIEAEQTKIEEEFLAEERRQEEEIEEINRQKRAAIQAGVPIGSLNGSGKENQPQHGTSGGHEEIKGLRRKKISKKRNLHSVTGGGEEVEVLGSI